MKQKRTLNIINTFAITDLNSISYPGEEKGGGGEGVRNKR